ncbi:MAG: dipeptidase [Alphaproteobacteria bacterium]|nr:dipeptidase [Alphaproteobacteria bacterium]MDD9920124.1 dipeptidase [Alphaproteobacteria bacterium]
MTTQAALEYITKNQQRFVEELKEWLRIPSISTQPEHKEDIQTAARWILGKISRIGFSHMELIETEGHPLIYAEWIVDETKPTVLFYGHYDVQPVDPLNEWHKPPFEPYEKDGNLYARGAADDKGQVMLALSALEAIAQTGSLPVNVKILLEGEEEAGGLAVEKYIQENPEKLKADAALICDTAMFNETLPSLVISLRGIIYTEIKVNGAQEDLHSGIYGGVAPNPIHALCVLISKLKGENNHVNIPNLQAATPSPTEEEKSFWKEDPLSIADKMAREMGVEQLVKEDIPALECLTRPTLEVHGIRGGFTAEGAKTVIPATATAKVSLRIPAGVTAQQAFDWFNEAIKENMPEGYTFDVLNLHGGQGVCIEQENPFIQAAAKALKNTYNLEPIFRREGASIPIGALFDEILNIPVVFMGFGLPDDNLHAPNEKFSLNQYKKGMQAVTYFFEEVKNL